MTRYYLILIVCLIPVFSVKSTPSDEVSTYTNNPGAQPQITVISTNADQVGLYEKFEAILQLQGATYQNPYDPEEINVRATFSSPTGKIWEIFGFYDNYNNRNQWKVRFSPNEIGIWKYSLQATDTSGTGNSEEYTFEAVGSEHHGWLKASSDNPHYFMHDDGTSFYGVGVSYPWNVNDGPTGLAQLQAYGANLFYYWNSTYDMGLGLIESINSGLGRYDQPKCGRIDQILEWSEARGLKMMLSIWPHDYLDVSVWQKKWDQNPYKQITSAVEFYGSEAAWIYQEKQYRYIIARWGYSRSLAIWESVCEINGTDGWAYGNHTDALNWVEKVHNFFRLNDPCGRPTTASQSGGLYWSDGYEIVDLPNVHLYETGWSPHYSNDPLRSSLWIYGNIAQQLWEDFDKPGIYGEAGYYNNYGGFSAGSKEYIQMYHNALWVTWASGLAATPLWWDFATKAIFTSDLMTQIHSFSKIVKNIDYAHIPFDQASISVSECDAYAMEGDSVAFGWIRDIDGNDVSEQLFLLEGLTDASYAIIWINTWTGDRIKTNMRVSQNGQLIDQIPQLTQNTMDIAFIIQSAESGDIPERLELIAYPTEIYSDTAYTSQITCFVLDAQRRICSQADNSVTFTLQGPGTLEGTNPAVPNNGVAGITFRANDHAGTAQIIASSSGLISDTLNIVVQKFLYIDDFEEYTSDEDLEKVWQKRYGTDTDVFLESSIVGEGKKSMRVEYSIGNGSLTYAGVSRSLIGEFSNANFLTFWLIPNGTGHSLTIRLYVDDTRYWYYIYALDGTEATTVTISLDDFKANYGATYLDRTALNSIALNINQGSGNWGNGTLYFDNFKFLADYETYIEEKEVLQIPENYILYQNYPNPFNSTTTIQYDVSEPSQVTIAIYNAKGQRIEILVNSQRDAGRYTISWDGSTVASGLYFIRMQAGNFEMTRKCLLLK